MAATEPIKDKSILKKMADHCLENGNLRNYTLFVMGTSTALRISDLLSLKWEQVYDEKRHEPMHFLTLHEKKTGKLKTIALNRQVLAALEMYHAKSRGEYIFSNHRRNEHPISRVQAWRIVRAAAQAVGASGNIGCHSLRKTWGYHAWTDENISPVIIMQIYNHSSFQITKRYLGVEQDELNRAYLMMELF